MEHSGYEPLMLLQYHEILPKIPTDNCFICKKDPVHFFTSGKQRLIMFDPMLRLGSFFRRRRNA